jgi:hypothetical protein
LQDLAESASSKNLFFFFSTAKIPKPELFWHILQDLGKYGRIWQILPDYQYANVFVQEKTQNKLKW